MKKQRIKPLLFDSYLMVIKNSIGAKIFRNFYAQINHKKVDVMKNGNLSCAFFVSSILVIFGLIKKIHCTVDGVIDDLERSGWKKIKHPKIGSILIWEEKTFSDKIPHKHIGFYIGRHRAISNSHEVKSPALHHWTFGKPSSLTHRKVKAIYWRSNLHR